MGTGPLALVPAELDAPALPSASAPWLEQAILLAVAAQHQEAAPAKGEVQAVLQVAVAVTAQRAARQGPTVATPP